MNHFLSNYAKRLTIPFFVFITGACVLVVEIVAIRILSPYFGNTIYTVSGVITVVLLGLSIGYYYGGKFADKYPNENIFYKIIILSGAVIISLYLFSIFFLPTFGYKLSIIKGPIISAFLLFFLPSLLLGTLSPFAVKLQKVRLEELGVGTASGQIFFWSTLGSILGSLASGFFLLPRFGIDAIMTGVGFVLIILGILGISGKKLKVKLFLSALLLFIFPMTLGSITEFQNFVYAENGIFYHKDSIYQKILIYDKEYRGKLARFLKQDLNSSSAEFLDSEEMAFEYTKYYALYHIFNDDIKETLTIGAGAYSIPKALLKDLDNVKVDVVEIDPLLFELGKEYFNLPADDKRLNNFVEDGRRFLQDSDKKYDLIFSDAYSSFFSTPEHLTTKEFFKLAKSRLSDKGVFIANVIGNLPAEAGLPSHQQAEKAESFALSEMKTFKSVFENSYFFAVDSPMLTRPQNLIFIGYNGKEIFDFSGSEIRNDKNYIISGLSEKIVDANKLNLDNYPILTDNFAPVDYLISRELKNL